MGAKVTVDIMALRAVGGLKETVIGARGAAGKEHSDLTKVVLEMVRQQRIANYLASVACRECPRLRMPTEVREEIESAELKESLGTAARRKPYLYERREEDRR